MHATGWSRGLEVTSGGTGVVSHAGLALVRQLPDRAGLTSGLSAALRRRWAAMTGAGSCRTWRARSRTGRG
jgi:hypothetical protein